MEGDKVTMWVFGYGSLMWRPGFAFEEQCRTRLVGYRRCFCVQSVHHRGNERRSGLVLGLDRGGMCEGVAFRVAQDNAADTLAYLRAREQVNGVYREARVPIVLERNGRHEADTAVTYIAERAHPSYVGELPLKRQAALILRSRGVSGYNLDYLINTLDHLEALGIRERHIERLVSIIGAHVFGGRGDDLSERMKVLTSPRAKAISRAVERIPTQALFLRPDQRRRFAYRKYLEGCF